MPEKFGGGVADSNFTPISLAMMIIVAVLILWLPRRFVIVAFLAGLFFIPSGNVFVVSGMHLMAVRILSVIACVRLLAMKASSHGEIYGKRWARLDTVFIVWVIWRSLAVVLLWQTKAAFTLECGHLWSYVLTYLVIRALVVDEEDVVRVIKTLAVVMIVSAAGMVYEHLRLQNVFGIYLGGLETTPAIREGRIRAQGLFRHSILAGSFAATLIPVVMTLWRAHKSNWFVILSISACLVAVVTSSSSTPIGALGGVVMAFAFWPFRKIMRLVRWGIVFALVCLNMIMKAPVWFIISHVSFVTGSTADFRAHLIDEFIRHFPDWWRVGIMDTNNWGESMWDYSDQFVAEGVTGGLLGLTLFITMLKGMYSKIGAARRKVSGDKRKEWFFWLLGCAIFGHINAWLGVSYWDNTIFAWFVLIAIVCAVTTRAPREMDASCAQRETSAEHWLLDNLEVQAR